MQGSLSGRTSLIARGRFVMRLEACPSRRGSFRLPSRSPRPLLCIQGRLPYQRSHPDFRNRGYPIGIATRFCFYGGTCFVSVAIFGHSFFASACWPVCGLFALLFVALWLRASLLVAFVAMCLAQWLSLAAKQLPAAARGTAEARRRRRGFTASAFAPATLWVQCCGMFSE